MLSLLFSRATRNDDEEDDVCVICGVMVIIIINAFANILPLTSSGFILSIFSNSPPKNKKILQLKPSPFD
jgi:hypothetical protein